jgi:hypothetical protein
LCVACALAPVRLWLLLLYVPRLTVFAIAARMHVDAAVAALVVAVDAEKADVVDVADVAEAAVEKTPRRSGYQ